MHIHYFQHDHFEDLGYIGHWARERGHTTSVTRFELESVIPDVESYDWLVVMGGKMGAYEEEKFPWLKAEKEAIRTAAEHGKKVLGICLGSQLIASAFGAEVYRNQFPERGFFKVRFNENALKDDVFQHFTQELEVLHLHNDTFDLPKDAVLMASSNCTPHQAFRLGQNVFALQFHFEITEACLGSFIVPQDNQKALDWVQDNETILSSAGSFEYNQLIFSKVLDAISSI